MSKSFTDFRDTLGLFPTGVTIITALDADGCAAGFTANSFNSVSLDPQLVLWSLAKSSNLIEVFKNTARYAIHFLATDQIALSHSFATAGFDRFANLEWALSESGLPILRGCVAHFECVSRHQYDGGDHIIFVGEVTHFQSDSEKKPLAYYRGRYSQCHPID